MNCFIFRSVDKFYMNAFQGKNFQITTLSFPHLILASLHFHTSTLTTLFHTSTLSSAATL